MENPSFPEIVVSCEHAGNIIPVEYQHLFLKAGEILTSHRGWDPGALQLAKIISDELKTPLYAFPASRLLIDVNRSLGHRQLFSEFSKVLSPFDKKKLIENYYAPYRNEMESFIRSRIELGNRVIHIGVHTFTPVLKRRIRQCDIGLLFDPSKEIEKQDCNRWSEHLHLMFPDLNIRFNQPYKGVDDGLTTYFRTVLKAGYYSGIELEVNQKFLDKEGNFNPDFASKITETLKHIGKMPA